MNLSEEQLAAYAKTNELLGLGADEESALMEQDELDNLPQERIMSSGPDSHFPAHIVSVGSVAKMREIVGFGPKHDAAKDGAGPPAPEPLPEEEIRGLLGSLDKTANFKADIPEETMKKIVRAAETYVLGNPDEVEAYVPLINAVLFPSRIAAFTGKTLEVPSGAKHIIQGDDPVVLNYQEIKIARDATVRIKTTFFIQSQITTYE